MQSHKYSSTNHSALIFTSSTLAIPSVVALIVGIACLFPKEHTRIANFLGIHKKFHDDDALIPGIIIAISIVAITIAALLIVMTRRYTAQTTKNAPHTVTTHQDSVYPDILIPAMNRYHEFIVAYESDSKAIVNPNSLNINNAQDVKTTIKHSVKRTTNITSTTKQTISMISASLLMLSSIALVMLAIAAARNHGAREFMHHIFNAISDDLHAQHITKDDAEYGIMIIAMMVLMACCIACIVIAYKNRYTHHIDSTQSYMALAQHKLAITYALCDQIDPLQNQLLTVQNLLKTSTEIVNDTLVASDSAKKSTQNNITALQREKSRLEFQLVDLHQNRDTELQTAIKCVERFLSITNPKSLCIFIACMEQCDAVNASQPLKSTLVNNIVQMMYRDGFDIMAGFDIIIHQFRQIIATELTQGDKDSSNTIESVQDAVYCRNAELTDIMRCWDSAQLHMMHMHDSIDAFKRMPYGSKAYENTLEIAHNALFALQHEIVTALSTDQDSLKSDEILGQYFSIDTKQCDLTLHSEFFKDVISKKELFLHKTVDPVTNLTKIAQQHEMCEEQDDHPQHSLSDSNLILNTEKHL